MGQGGWVYMMSNKPYGMLYIGVTAHLAARVQQHRIDTGSAYCRRYGFKTLVFAEQHETIQDAITREKQLKAWRRSWKDDLIATINPTWADLYDQLHLVGLPRQTAPPNRHPSERWDLLRRGGTLYVTQSALRGRETLLAAGYPSFRWDDDT
jgi:putative endonuclease